jgi:tRNA threonylcarbamoyladenosine biosynthesis protein TsaB
MNILLLESSSRNIEFGYSKNDKIVIVKKLDSENNADSLIYMIKEIFDKESIDFKEIDVISLSNGPGSFTGLRIGSAIAKGFCFILGCKLIEIPTLNIIANKYKKSEGNKVYSSVIFTNFKSKEFYTADYTIGNSGLKRVSEYAIKSIETVIKGIYVLNEKNEFDFPDNSEVIDVSGISNINSQLELSIKYINNNRFSDIITAEPFYMKDFVPVQKVRTNKNKI